MEKEIAYLTRKSRADAILENTARHLREILREAVRDLDPFPQFLNSFLVQGVEAEPGEAGRSDLGCVLVCPDGELYEYTCSVDVNRLSFELARDEKLKKLDLPPRDYVPYAYNAIGEVTRLLLERLQT